MRIYLYLSCLLLGACTGMPKAIQNMNVVDVSYSQAIQNIDDYKNVPVRWGGIIIDVENEEDFSLVQVLFYPLNYSGRPQINDPHGGRFVIKSTEFFDPVVYAKDKRISVVGTLNRDIQRTVGGELSGFHRYNLWQFIYGQSTRTTIMDMVDMAPITMDIIVTHLSVEDTITRIGTKANY